MKAFANFHPLVLLIYFLSVITIAMFVSNPVLQCCALAGGAVFCTTLQRLRSNLGDLCFYLPLFLMTAVTNPLFSHNGVTPLFFLNGNPVTLEAVLCGISIATMVIGVMMWCKNYSLIMTSDKFLYLFAKAIPKLSLVISMALRFVPMFKKQMHRVNRAQKVMGLYSRQSYVDRMLGALRVFSAMITWSMESAMDTSSSMRARGYGLKGHSNFSLFRFTPRDMIFLAAQICLTVAALIGISLQTVEFYFYPSLSPIPETPLSVATYLAYGTVCLLPFINEIKERLQWNYCISKI